MNGTPTVAARGWYASHLVQKIVGVVLLRPSHKQTPSSLQCLITVLVSDRAGSPTAANQSTTCSGA